MRVGLIGFDLDGFNLKHTVRIMRKRFRVLRQNHALYVPKWRSRHGWLAFH